VFNPTTDTSITLRWMREGTGFVVGLVDKLADDELREPSALPDWTRAHVIAHLARNAEAIGRLARWARTGLQTPMYPSYQRRTLDIESSARQEIETLRAELTDTAAALAREIGQLDELSWLAMVRTAQGAEVPATVIPWMRAREVWLHGVDLDAGSGLDALPAELLDALLANIAGEMSGKDGCPGATLAPTDRGYRCALGVEPIDTAAVPTVRGSAADLVAWLGGRRLVAELTAATASGPVEVPTLPRWL
jgi:maleylpyruvate isomerase